VSGWSRSLTIALVTAISMLAGCQYLPSIPLPANPFRSEASPEPAAPAATPAAGASPVPAPAAPKPAFTAFWVKNHRVTEMWSGPADASGVVSFGPTSAQFCSFQVVQPPNGPRLYVLNPYSANYLWIDADAVGPVPNPPERRPGPKPPNQNCSDAIYDG